MIDYWRADVSNNQKVSPFWSYENQWVFVSYLLLVSLTWILDCWLENWIFLTFVKVFCFKMTSKGCDFKIAIIHKKLLSLLNMICYRLCNMDCFEFHAQPRTIKGTAKFGLAAPAEWLPWAKRGDLSCLLSFFLVYFFPFCPRLSVTLQAMAALIMEPR
jgi:hypothetical protein